MKHLKKGKLAGILAIVLVSGAAAFFFGKLSPLSAEASIQDESNPEITTLLTEMNMSVATDNREVPDFELLDMDGKAVHLSDFKGETVLLGFFTTW